LSGCTIILAGKISNETLKIVKSLFENIELKASAKIANLIRPAETPEKKVFMEVPGSLQSAIRIGRQTVNRADPEYAELIILNVILGGYFGSRLMANIREDKGYTYGISSGITSLHDTGYFYIATEVGSDVCLPALTEIYHEIQRLHEQPVPEKELMLVKNYLIGSFLGSLENIFSYADKFKNIYYYGIGYEFYERYFNTLREIGSGRIQDLARQYLKIESLTEIVVGKK
jgi:predicted Zn-dependent peptidase